MQFYEQYLAYIRKIINNNATITINYQEGVVVTGPFINAGAVLLGGVLGAVLSQRLPERIRVSMTSIFGLASLGIGILLVVKCANLPVMVLATLLGALTGEFCYLEKGINAAVGKAQRMVSRPGKHGGGHDAFVQNYVAIIILFCASGTGIFGSMHEGMTGDPSILIAKAFLDFFTATIFACTLGIAVAAISVPMLIIQLTLAACATLILPMTTPAMMADFTAVGGLLLVATGLRICGIKMFAVVNMLPALLLAMPLSAAWTAFFA
jgi:hypothetical protein